ncbi:MAG: hypothetical protein ABJA78_20595, partial [Ferruginibacter sp.]
MRHIQHDFFLYNYLQVMPSIIKATIDDFKLLTDLGKQTFIESHGHSAKKEDVDTYVAGKMSAAFFR